MREIDRRRSFRALTAASVAASVLFFIAAAICIFVSAGSLDIYLPESEEARYFVPETEGVNVTVHPDEPRLLTVTADSGARGKFFINNTRETGVGFIQTAFEYVEVLPGGIIVNKSNGNFSGCEAVCLITSIYLTLMTVIFVVSFILRCRYELFSYSTLYYGGMMLFFTVFAVNTVKCSVDLLYRPEFSFMNNVYGWLKNASSAFMYITLPFMALFVLALGISNIVLIRREGKSFVNMLGMILCVLIAGGYAGLLLLDRSLAMGSEQEMRVYGAVESSYATVFIYLEVMLMSAMLCGLISVKKKPSPDRTHIIILGCAIADDGTPLPLLRGRIDRALAFAAEQEKSGRKVIFVPSGGQGSDEVISEAESMKNYLISKGIPEERILLENKSASTQENMTFSIEKIGEVCSDPKLIFSTSGYHVLRSGMITRSLGIEAEGIGSKTKWYFWPNAFIREFIGLLASKWKQHIFWLVLFGGSFVVINLIIPL
ncbi:MAG: YdcF family protein [Ruminococcus sp.]|nr:YdcF family protein [Ruminococcus sp.]